MQFWERTFSHYIQHEIIEQKNDHDDNDSHFDHNKTHLDTRSTTFFSVLNFAGSDDSLLFKNEFKRSGSEVGTMPELDYYNSNENTVKIDDKEIPMKEIIFTKLTQIQHDMLSFDVPVH